MAIVRKRENSILTSILTPTPLNACRKSTRRTKFSGIKNRGQHTTERTGILQLLKGDCGRRRLRLLSSLVSWPFTLGGISEAAKATNGLKQALVMKTLRVLSGQLSLKQYLNLLSTVVIQAVCKELLEKPLGPALTMKPRVRLADMLCMKAQAVLPRPYLSISP